MKSLQLTPNRMLRSINGTKIKDKISTKSMLEKFGLLSVNQLSAQIKLTETWKSLNVEDYPVKLDPYNRQESGSTTALRPRFNRVFNDTFRLQMSQHSFHADAAKLWNGAQAQVATATTLAAAKTAILKYVTSLPV